MKLMLNYSFDDEKKDPSESDVDRETCPQHILYVLRVLYFYSLPSATVVLYVVVLCTTQSEC